MATSLIRFSIAETSQCYVVAATGEAEGPTLCKIILLLAPYRARDVGYIYTSTT